MTHRQNSWILGGLALAFIALTAAAEAPTLKFTFSDVNAPGATETDTYGINNAGVIAGDWVDSAGVQHGMVLTAKKLLSPTNKTCTTTPGSTSIAFYAINSADVAVGWCLNNNGKEVGFTFGGGKFTNVAIKGALEIESTGINNAGDIAGTYVDSAGNQHGFLLAGTKLTTIDAPGVQATFGWSVNNYGVVTVYGTNSAGTYVSFTTKDGKKFTQYSAPQAGSLGTVIHAIDSKGDIDGTYYDSASNVHGWLWNKTAYYSLDDPNGCKCDTRADGLNDTLTVVGRYSTSLGGASVGYKATTSQ
ncbi:MAG TPA: hypothetical protein VF753_00675 [Terriglobales bacterium]